MKSSSPKNVIFANFRFLVRGGGPLVILKGPFKGSLGRRQGRAFKSGRVTKRAVTVIKKTKEKESIRGVKIDVLRNMQKHNAFYYF